MALRIVRCLCGFAMFVLFPPKAQTVLVGIGLDWRNLPGTLLGLLAGIHSWRASLRAAEKGGLRLHRNANSSRMAGRNSGSGNRD